MMTERARQLLDELLKEPGVSAVLLPSSSGRLGVRLDLAPANKKNEEEIKALFGKDRKFICVIFS